MRLTCRYRNPKAELVVVSSLALPQTSPTTYTMPDPHHINRLQTRFIERRGSLSSRHIYECKGSSECEKHPKQHWASTLQNTITYRQLNNVWDHVGKNETSTIEGNLYAFLLAEGSRSPKSMYYVLGSGKTEPW
jgi:hypothetical protein